MERIKHNVPHKRIKIGTDCSGIETPILALELLGVDFDHKFSCDNDPKILETIGKNFNPEIVYVDMLNRNHKVLPKCDIYVCGFPCQPFSTLNPFQEGFDDEAKGGIFFECIKTIKANSPKVFILENVMGLINQNNGKTFEGVKHHLSKLTNYHIHYGIYNTIDYGIPQNRNRVYFIGIRKDCSKKKYEKPNSIPLEIRVTDLLEYEPEDKDDRLYILTNHQKKLLRELEKTKNIDFRDPWVVNIYVSSVKRMSPKLDISPCLVSARGSVFYYITSEGRKLSARECLRLQGVPDNFVMLDEIQTYKQAGNSMSVNVLCFIFDEIFNCVNF